MSMAAFMMGLVFFAALLNTSTALHTNIMTEPPAVRIAPFDPSTYPFLADEYRFRPTYYSYYPIQLSYIFREYGGRNTTAAELTTKCPTGMVFMSIDFVSAGLPQGWAGKCPADYNPDMTGNRAYPHDICRSNTDLAKFGWTHHSVPGGISCTSPTVQSITAKACEGRAACTHLPSEHDYALTCEKFKLLWKSFAAFLSCGKPVISKLTPASLSYAQNETLYITGARGPEPGKYVDTPYCTVQFHVMSGPKKGDHLRPCKFISGSLLSVTFATLPMTNYNITTMVTIWYDGYQSATAARSNTMALLSVAPIFVGWSTPVLPFDQNTAVQLFGNYFVDTGHIIARLTIEDGTVMTAPVTFIDSKTLQIIMPPYNVPMLWKGLEVTLEISHESEDPAQPGASRLWQIVAGETNNIDSALRLTYYDPSTLPSFKGRFIELGVRSASSLNGSWVHVSNFTGVESFPPTEICRYRHGNSSIPYAVITDPKYEVPARITGQEKDRLRIPDVINCYKVAHKALQSAGGTDMLIQRYNNTRGLLWAVRGGGVGNDDTMSVTVDMKGNIFITAHVYGLATLGSNLMSRGSDGQQDVRFTGSQTSNRIRKMIVIKYDRGGKLLWSTEVGSCLSHRCKLNTIDIDEQGHVHVSGSFYSTVSIASGCATTTCQTVKPLRPQDGSERHAFLSGDRACILENMEAYNDTDRCQHIPMAILKSSTPCTESAEAWTRCQTDTFLSRIDHNGTVFWFHNIATNQTYMRATPLAHLYFLRIQPWIDGANLAYRQIPEKLSASRDPDTTMLLLRDKTVRVYPIFPSLKDAYHIEIQSNRTELSLDRIQRCISTVNMAFMKLQKKALLSNLEFFASLSERAAYLTRIPYELMSHSGIFLPVKQLVVQNAAAYRLLALQSSSIDFEFDQFTREKIIKLVDDLNARIDNVEKAIQSPLDSDVVAGFSAPGLMFAGIVRKLFGYYVGRIRAMREAFGAQMYHTEVQSIFQCSGSLIQDYPVRPGNVDIQKGGMVMAIKLSADRFKPLDSAFIAEFEKNLVSRFLPAGGFQKKIRPLIQTMPNLLTQSADRTTLTLTLPKVGPELYSVATAETMTISIPASLTEAGSTYPFVAQFVVRPDNRGMLWNTKTIVGDMYARPTEVDFRDGENYAMSLVGSMPIAGDFFKPLTPEVREALANAFVPSGYDNEYPEPYKWTTIMKPQLQEPARMWLDNNNTRLNVRLSPSRKYDIPVAETITVTIPATATVKGYAHPIGKFLIRNGVEGTLKFALNSKNAGSGSYTVVLPIQADRFPARSQRVIQALAGAIHSPDVPYVKNGFMEIIKPMLMDPIYESSWIWNLAGTAVTIQLPAANSKGYDPQEQETVMFIVPPEASQLGNRHEFMPMQIAAGIGQSAQWLGSSAFLPWNVQNASSP